MKDCDVFSQIRDNLESFHPNATCENKHLYHLQITINENKHLYHLQITTNDD